MGWITGRMVGFDTETTGVDARHDRVVTAAVIERDGADGPVSRRAWLLNPGIEIPAGATAIHGVTTERARSEGAPPGEALEEIASALAAALAVGHPIVGFNVGFDLGILEADLARHGLPTLVARLGGTSSAALRPIVDPLVLDRHLNRYRKGKRKLIDLCGVYGVAVDGDGLHAADADVEATLDLIQAMARAHPAIGEAAVSDLHDQQVASHAVWADNFSAWLRSQGRVDDLPERAWPLPERWPEGAGGGILD